MYAVITRACRCVGDHAHVDAPREVGTRLACWASFSTTSSSSTGRRRGTPSDRARAEAVRDALIARASSSAVVGCDPGRLRRGSSRGFTVARTSTISRADPRKTGWLDADTYFSRVRGMRARRGRLDLPARHGMSSMVRWPRASRWCARPGTTRRAISAMGFCLLNTSRRRERRACTRCCTGRDRRLGRPPRQRHAGHLLGRPVGALLSVHQYPYYPGSGAPTEIGGANARGRRSTSGSPAAAAMPSTQRFRPRVPPSDREVRPDVLLISAGFDAFEHDPLAACA